MKTYFIAIRRAYRVFGGNLWWLTMAGDLALCGAAIWVTLKLLE